MLGFNVCSSLDIQTATFANSWTARARRHDVNLTIVNDDFMWAEKVTQRRSTLLCSLSASITALIIIDCLRHLNRPVKLGGEVFFAARPDDQRISPFPWGLRIDGESLWAIRRNGCDGARL